MENYKNLIQKMSKIKQIEQEQKCLEMKKKNIIHEMLFNFYQLIAF